MEDAKKDCNPAALFVGLMRDPEYTWRIGADGEIKFIFKGNVVYSVKMEDIVGWVDKAVDKTRFKMEDGANAGQPDCV